MAGEPGDDGEQGPNGMKGELGPNGKPGRAGDPVSDDYVTCQCTMSFTSFVHMYVHNIVHCMCMVVYVHTSVHVHMHH